MLEFLKANWDHLPPLPKKPKLPPGLLNLKARRAWLSIRPEFNYGDERDKTQRDEMRRAKRQLERDEAWARRAKRQQLRADKKAKALAAKAAARANGGNKKAFLPLGLSTAQNKPAPAPKPTVKRSATAPPNSKAPAAKVINGWSALEGARPSVTRSGTLPAGARVVYTVPAASGHGGRPRPGMPSRQATVPVQRTQARAAGGTPPKRPAVRAATQPVTKTAAAGTTTQQPRVTRSATQPSVKRR